VQHPGRPHGAHLQGRRRGRPPRRRDEQRDPGQAPRRLTVSTAGSAEAKRFANRRGPARMSRILRFLVIVTALTHLPVALGVAELARRLGWPLPALIGFAWAVAGVTLFVGRARAGMPDRKGRHPALVRLVDIPYFIHWCACLWTLVPSVLAAVFAPIVDLLRGSPPHVPAGVFMYAYLSGLAVAGYGVLVRRRWYRVVERDVPVPGLDARFEGLRVAPLSDLHIGTLTPKSWGLRWSRSANERAPDLAVVTGDLVTSGTDFHEDVADVVGALRARDGVFVSMGNHDYFGEGEPLVSLLRARGVAVLRNEGVAIERNGAKLWHVAPARRPGQAHASPARRSDHGPARARSEPVRPGRGGGRERRLERPHPWRPDRRPVPLPVREPRELQLPVQRRLLSPRAVRPLRAPRPRHHRPPDAPRRPARGHHPRPPRCLTRRARGELERASAMWNGCGSAGAARSRTSRPASTASVETRPFHDADACS